MADKSTNGRAEVGLPAVMLPFGLEALMELNRPALTAMAQMNGRVYENIATINRNWAAFLNRRLKEDFAMPSQLAACKTVQEMYGVYADFFQTAVTQYQSEFEQLSKLGKALAEDTAHALQAPLEATASEARRHN